MADHHKYFTEGNAKSVAYEFMMFSFLIEKLRWSAEETAEFRPGNIEWLGTGHTDDSRKRELYALLESLLLHTRVLYDFFYKLPTRDDLSAPFFADKWDASPPPEGTYLDLVANPKSKNQINKAVAHLTAERADYSPIEKKWNVEAIGIEMNEVITEFMKKVPEDRKAWFSFTS